MKSLLGILFLTALIFIPFVSSAQETTSANHDGSGSGRMSYYYEKPTMQNLSKLYWALSKLDLNSDDNIDSFLMINECDLYRDYAHNEFEWKSIRDAARKGIEEDRKTYPLRFRFLQPVKLGEYDFEKEGFHILEEYKIKGVRRFEMMADDYQDSICGTAKEIAGYPRGLLLQLNRPFILDFLPMKPEKAREFINRKIKPPQGNRPAQQTKEEVYDQRVVYLALNVKIFSFREDFRTREGRDLADFLGVLEGFEIYENQDSVDFIYAENFRRRKKKSPLEQEMKKHYESKKGVTSEEQGEGGGSTEAAQPPEIAEEEPE